jgi:hypothetical protein
LEYDKIKNKAINNIQMNMVKTIIELTYVMNMALMKDLKKIDVNQNDIP